MTKRSKSKVRRPVAIDLYSGAGGMSLGFEQAGFDILLGVDFDGYHTATHERNFPYGASLCASVADLTVDDVRSHLPDGTDIDLVFGGPPCQGFSHMGVRDTEDPRNTLVASFVKMVDALQPKTFVMENVPGMQSGRTKAIFLHAIEGFKKAGYEVTWPVRKLNAADFGVPQLRERLFVLGVRKDLGVVAQYPEQALAGQPQRPTVLEAIGDLPDVDRKDELFKVDETDYDKEPSKDHRYARVARGIVRDRSDFSRPRKWEKGTCRGCLRVKHADKVKTLYSATPPGSMVPGHKLPRLDPAGLSPTLRAGSSSERGSFTAPRPVHPLEPRVITAREAARLHGFPDWFALYPAKWHAYRQVGNAVCPPVARAIGAKLMDALGIEASKLPRPITELSNEFRLPENRPKTHRRIPELEHYPLVVDWLFDRAYSIKTKKLRRKSFTAEDIKSAIKKSGAKLPRVRPEQFLATVARSRNVKKILKRPVSHGYSIRIKDPDAGTGEFVPTDTPGTIDDKDVILVKSNELNEAREIQFTEQCTTVEAAVSVLENKSALGLLSGGKWISATVERELLGVPSKSVLEVTVKTKRGAALSALLLVADNGNLPPKSRISKDLKNKGYRFGLVSGFLTNEHLIVVAIDNARDLTREVFRQVFVKAR